MQGDGPMEYADAQAEAEAEQIQIAEGYATEAEVQNKIESIRKEARIISENMKQFGGSFVVSLASAMDRADDINLRKIHDAFPEYWKKYLKMEQISGKNTY